MTDRKDETGLDALFAAARDEAPMPSGDFMTRLQAQALAEMPQAGARVAEPGFFAQLREALGGWKGASGLAAASLVGLWLGISPPAAVSEYWPGASQVSLGEIGLDPASGYDLAWIEG